MINRDILPKQNNRFMYENKQQRSTKVGAPNLEAAKDKNELSDLEKKV